MRCLIAFALMAGPAFADTTCTFTTECFDGEGCSDTSFTFSLTDAGEIVSDAETFAVTETTVGGASVWFGTTGSGAHLLSLSEEGARYSAHLPGPGLVITYLGQCAPE